MRKCILMPEKLTLSVMITINNYLDYKSIQKFGDVNINPSQQLIG